MITIAEAYNLDFNVYYKEPQLKIIRIDSDIIIEALYGILDDEDADLIIQIIADMQNQRNKNKRMIQYEEGACY